MESIQYKRRGILQRIYKSRAYYLLSIPFFLFIVLFKYIPMYGMVLAFKDYKFREGIWGSPWAGFKYFEQLFEAFSFWEVFRNTVIISLQRLIFVFPCAVILALFINEIRNSRVKKVFQTFSYLPYFISWVVAASLVQDIFALNGPINTVIEFFGGEPIFFMADSSYFRSVLVLINIWKSCGWSSVIYIAAITSIDPDLYEAAEIDGARKLQQIWHITLPCIRSTIITMFILEVGKLMYSGFDQIYNLYNSAVYSVADVLDTYTYRQGLVDSNYSYATAAGMFQNIIGFILVIISNYVVKRIGNGEEEGIW